MLLTFHHAVSDGWSRGILTREWSTLYQAAVDGRPSPLAAPSLCYADVARWERDRLRGALLDERIAFWRDHLDGAPRGIELPFDRRPSPGTPPRGAAVRSRLPRELSVALTELARRHDATLFMVLLSAFELLLWRWSRQDDLVVGTVVSDRPHPETEELIGCFVNFLPVRVRVPVEEDALAVIRAVRTAVLGAWAHQDCPFEKLVEAVAPRRGAGGGNPLYNVGFLLQSFPAGDLAADLETEILPVTNGAALLDLRVVAFEDRSTGEIDLWWELDQNRFDVTTIERLAAAYEASVRHLVERPADRLTELGPPPGLAPAEPRPRLVVAATFTADPIVKPVRFWLERLGIDLEVEIAPYHQVFQQLLDAGSAAGGNRAGVNALLVRIEDWAGSGPPDAAAGRAADDLVAALTEAAGRGGAPWVVLFCPPSPGFLETLEDRDVPSACERRVAEAAEALSGVYVTTSRELGTLYPVAAPHDPHADRLGHVPYTPTFFTALASLLARRLYALRHPPCKVVAVDCDGTLWDGVCGEDGPLGVRLGAGHRALQEELVRQQEAGALICLCSKNVEADVAAVFDQRPEMPLGRHHLAAWRVSWDRKSESLRSLARELDLGLDSFVFLDDNPVECAEVQAGCPEVTTLRVPENPADIPHFLRHVWAFDRLKVTEEDRRRTAMYREQRQREELRQSAATLEEFLAGLELEVDVRPVAAEHLPRVAQLIQRTNQLNLTLVRRDEAQVRGVLAGAMEGLEVEVRDRFGDYGLVGAVLFEAAPDALVVDTLVLSCRVLGRGVERRLLARLGEIALGRGLARVDLPWVRGDRNQPALDFLRAVAEPFEEPRGDGLLFRLPAEAAASSARSAGSTRSAVSEEDA